jgi:hypothetical protein
VARTLLWLPFLSSLGPIINDYLDIATQNLIEKYATTRYNQRAEKEADIVGLQLMALSGYHPKKAVELWKYLSSLNNSTKSETHFETDEIELQDFFASHPIDNVRSDYLSDILPVAEKIYEETIDKDGRAITFVFDDHVKELNKPIKIIKNTKEQIISRIWGSLRHLIGLNPES